MKMCVGGEGRYREVPTYAIVDADRVPNSTKRGTYVRFITQAGSKNAKKYLKLQTNSIHIADRKGEGVKKSQNPVDVI